MMQLSAAASLWISGEVIQKAVEEKRATEVFHRKERVVHWPGHSFSTGNRQRGNGLRRFNAIDEFIDGCLQARIIFEILSHFFTGMEDGGVIPPPEFVTNFR